jgi:hypothetical protein
MKGVTLVPFCMGADKMVASVGTGQTEFHPLYFTIGGIHNEVRRAHCEAVLPVAFLAIPKGLTYFPNVLAELQAKFIVSCT